MTDAASLLLAIDSTQVKTGVNELDRLTAAGARAETSAQRVTKASNQQAVATRNVAQASGQARAGMQQLGFQVGDVAAQYSAGTRPAQIFAQQIGQVMQAVQLTAGSTGKLASFLSGPWGLAVSVGASVTAVLVSRLMQGKEAAQDKKTALEQLQDAVEDYTKANGKAAQAESIQIRLLDFAAQEMLKKAAATREATKALLEQARAQLVADRSDTRSPDMNRQFRIQTGDAAIRELDALIVKQDQAVKGWQTLARQKGAERIMLDVAAATDKATAAQEKFLMQRFSLNKKFTEGKFGDGASAEAKLRTEMEAITRARDAAIAAANKHEKADNSAAKAAREAAKAAREQAKEIRELQSAYEDLERRFDPAAATARDFMESMKNIETVRLAGLIDDAKALNFVLAAVFGQAYALEKTLEKLQKDAGFDPLEPIVKVNNSVDDLVDDLQRANDQLLDMASYLQQIGGLAGVIGGLTEGLVTGNFAGLGPTGMLINQIVAGKDGSDKQLAELTNGLYEIFGIGGSFGKTLAGALQGAATGAIAGEAIIGGKTGSSIGAGLGAILGSEFMAAVSGPLAMASAANQIIGDIFGFKGGPLGIFTGLFTSAKKGSASILGGSVSLSGNSGSRKEAAGDAADSVLDALKAIAGELSAQVDSALGLVSIGMRKEDWRVDPTGRGRTKGSGVIDFGKDSEAAIAFAVQNLINDGVLKGLRDSTLNLLKNGDFEEQLKKALAFEGVFKELAAQTNPFSAALREMQASMAELSRVFSEAGATSEEFAALQQLQANKLRELIDQASSTYRSTFSTDAEKLTFAKDQISSVLTPLGFGSVDTVEEYKALVASVDMASQAGLELFGALMNLADEFGVVKDAAEATEAAATAATAAAKAQADAEAQAAEAAAKARAQMTSQLNIQLLQALGQSEAALTMQRALELQALDASLRPLQMQVWAAQDASRAMEDVARTAQTAWQAAEKAAQETSRIEADAIQRVDQAKNDLLATYRRERGELDETASRFRSFGDDLRAFRDSLAAQGGAMSRSQALVNLMKVGGLAGAGNEQALGQLPGTAREFLDVSRSSAKSLLDYQRDVALVANYVGAGIKAADKQVSNAERQIAALERQVGSLVDLNEGVLTVRQAIDQLQQAQRGQAVAAEAAARARDEAAARDRAAQIEAAQKIVVTNEAIAMRMATLEKLFKGAIQGDALTVRGDADTPVYTTAAP